MKPLSPHDPLDDLIAAALHGELTPEERIQFDNRLQTDPAARAAYQEAQLMHDLLEKTHKEAQPDPAFEQRMVSGVRRKLNDDKHRETAWESVLALWNGIRKLLQLLSFGKHPGLAGSFVILAILAILAGVALGPITAGIEKAKESAAMQQARMNMLAEKDEAQLVQKPVLQSSVDTLDRNQETLAAGLAKSSGGPVTVTSTTTSSTAPVVAFNDTASSVQSADSTAASSMPMAPINSPAASSASTWNENAGTDSQSKRLPEPQVKSLASVQEMDDIKIANSERTVAEESLDELKAQNPALQNSINNKATGAMPSAPATPATPPTVDTRKLIRNAELELEVKSFQSTMDQITTLTKAAGGYVDTSNSQKGGNGKLQGTVVVKVLPQNLDDFLLKLRDLGKVENQSVSTEDVTKDYYDTAARLDNSRRMEAQLQDLLKHENSKVSDLLQVERELGRVRGEIEQMQGTLKVYDFAVAYATVTMQVRETDLNQAAAYLLKEQDEFALFATDVEGTFQKARQAADSFKAQILEANLNHNSGTDVSAELMVMVAPDQIEPFLTQIRSLGRVANFTRQTQRVAKDGGDSDQPADQTLTDKDKVQVHLTIRSDDESRKQVALTVVTAAVDDALDQAKTAALANAGTEILSSSLNKTPEGQSTAQLSVRVPGKSYQALLTSLRALGRTASFSLQREDNSGPGADGDDAPVIVSLSLTDDDTPLQQTEMSIATNDVDNQSQQIKKDAATAGVQVKASSFERQPNGTETAQLTFRLPMSKYPAFVENLKQLGKVESLTVRRDDRPDQTHTDDSAPAEISLQMHNQGNIVTDDNGLWATLRETFGEGMAALLGSVKVIGVLLAFLTPWVVTIAILAWIGRRIYIWRKK